jgi:hypothetical protein
LSSSSRDWQRYLLLKKEDGGRVRVLRREMAKKGVAQGRSTWMRYSRRDREVEGRVEENRVEGRMDGVQRRKARITE